MTLNFVIQATVKIIVNVSINRIFQRMNENINRRFVTINNESNENNQNNFNQNENNNNNDQRFYVNDINFFDFYFDKKSTSTNSSINNFEKNYIFRNVHVFLNQIKSVTFIKK